MSNITIEVPLNIDDIIKQLTAKDKIDLVKKLERETRKQRWSSFISKVSQRFVKNPISEEEILRVCKEVRRKNYEKSTKNCY